MLINRRFFLKFSFYTGLAGALFRPWQIARSAGAFSTGSYQATLYSLFGEQTVAVSDLVKLQLPAIAEDGAVVPITISSDLDNIEHIWILVEKNPTPLAAELVLTSPALAFMTTRIKMAESCAVVVVVKTPALLLMNQQWVKVMQGGCGTG
ncbi:thiosulfate oxidation carrier protein SoxY [Methylomonas paludis]|uniref:Thiosulfate oxidation carrier protein SoxY n=1 Tax=Methylomonas paludis TaxID=1173101 RepID=A0A975R964_9GAMM|nr:thiosulfate oxidation carrier protein SoxY [Methylomonas paludis]QWF69904.1 thiosulfate oxidation carrier protein SoxY [Methylomonas paludis]